MRTHHVEDELAESFDPSPAPTMSPAGDPQHADIRAMVDPPPRICEQGPCRHYHTFVVMMDAQTAMAGRVEKDDQGNIQLAGAPEADPVRVERHHYCYPTDGVEFILGAMPVLECNRWCPTSFHSKREVEETRNHWLYSPDGNEYRTALDAWRERQKSLADAEDAAIAAAAAEIAAAASVRGESDTTENPETGDTTP